MRNGIAVQASGIASLGRGGDSTLMHVSPEEVSVLSQLGDITVNPYTGLPEAFGLKGLLKGIGSILTPIVGAGVAGPLGAMLMGGMYEGLTSKNLAQGILGGITGLVGAKALQKAAGLKKLPVPVGMEGKMFENTAGRGFSEALSLSDVVTGLRSGGATRALDYMSSPHMATIVYPQMGNLAQYSAQQDRIAPGEGEYNEAVRKAYERYHKRHGAGNPYAPLYLRRRGYSEGGSVGDWFEFSGDDRRIRVGTELQEHFQGMSPSDRIAFLRSARDEGADTSHLINLALGGTGAGHSGHPSSGVFEKILDGQTDWEFEGQEIVSYPSPDAHALRNLPQWMRDEIDVSVSPLNPNAPVSVQQNIDFWTGRVDNIPGGGTYTGPLTPPPTSGQHGADAPNTFGDLPLSPDDPHYDPTNPDYDPYDDPTHPAYRPAVGGDTFTGSRGGGVGGSSGQPVVNYTPGFSPEYLYFDQGVQTGQIDPTEGWDQRRGLVSPERREAWEMMQNDLTDREWEAWSTANFSPEERAELEGRTSGTINADVPYLNPIEPTLSSAAPGVGVDPFNIPGMNNPMQAQLPRFLQEGSEQELLGAMGYAEGGIIGLGGSPLGEEDDPIIEAAVLAILGQMAHEQKDAAIRQFIEVYGQEAFVQLREMVLQEMAPGSQTEGMIEGPGTGTSDSIPMAIPSHPPAAVSNGEFIVPADVVMGLGNGDSQEGSRQLYEMMEQVRQGI